MKEREAGRMSWAYLNGTDEGEEQREQDDPLLKSPHGVCRAGMESLGPSSLPQLLKPLIGLGGANTLAAPWFIPLFAPQMAAFDL